jgi:hypothetical protein
MKCPNIDDAEWAERIEGENHLQPSKDTNEASDEGASTAEFVCDLCEDSDNNFDATGKKGKCQRIFDRAQKNSKRCEKRKGRPGVIRGCCPSDECKSAQERLRTRLDNRKQAKAAAQAAKKAVTDAKAAKASRAEVKDLRAKLKAARAVLKTARGEVKKIVTEKDAACGTRKNKVEEAKTYTPEDFALTKSNECPEGSKSVDYKTCHDEAANYQWPGQKPGHTQRWDEEDHDPEFGNGWTFMPPGCVLYIGWRGDSHEAQVRWNPNQNGKNDGHRARVCEKI